ncbi:MAG: SDR family oxidoreductase [Clostridia bacterium]|nr:SDR family oxidoreductase [Clostridia bacterium]
MKLVLAGAFGKLGSDILRAAVKEGHEVVAIDLVTREMDFDGFTAKTVDVTKKEQLEGVCEGADAVITTVGLTRTSATVTNYDIDLNGNLNLLAEAKRAGVKKFAYISVLKADKNPDVPMLDAKHKFELALKESGIDYVIFRPTGYFYDIAKVFMPMIEKGEVTLLGKEDVSANVIDTTELAEYVLLHLNDTNVTYDIGGTETYTYEEIAKMFFAAAGKEPVIKRAPVFLFSVLAWINKLKKNGKEAIIKFSKWTLTESMVAENKYGKLSFKEYIQNCYKKEGK